VEITVEYGVVREGEVERGGDEAYEHFARFVVQ